MVNGIKDHNLSTSDNPTHKHEGLPPVAYATK